MQFLRFYPRNPINLYIQTIDVVKILDIYKKEIKELNNTSLNSGFQFAKEDIKADF